MASPANGPKAAAGLSLFAGFLWAAYYFIVLGISPGVAPSALLGPPLLIGGIPYVILSYRQGHAKALRDLWRDRAAYLRLSLLAGMMVSVLAGTYAAGPVDTSLLSLVGDVALSPILLIAFFGEGRERATKVPFVAGLLLCGAGASLAIVGNGSVEPIRGWAWLLLPAIPLAVSGYFLFTAQASRSVPMSAVVGQSTVGAGLVGTALSPVLPGGLVGLAVGSPVDWFFIVLLGVTSFFLAPWLYFRAIEFAGLILPSLLMSSIPVFTLGLSVVILRVVPPWVALAGVPVAVAGALLALQGEHPPWTPQYPALAETPS